MAILESLHQIDRILTSDRSISLVRIKGEIDCGHHWVKISRVNSTGRLQRGAGYDFSPRVAISKAWSEFCERGAFQLGTLNGVKSSNGYAAHFDLKSAIANAVGELIERDAVLVAWMLGLRARAVAIRFHMNPLLKLRADYLLKHGFKARFGILGKNGTFSIGVGIIEKNGRLSFHSCATQNRNDLFRKLLNDMYMAASSWNESLRLMLTFDSNLKRPGIRPSDHHLYHLLNYSQKLADFISPDSSENIFPEFKCNVLNETQSVPEALKTKINIMRAVSSESQDLFFGETTNERIHWRRLYSVADENRIEPNVCYDPHPID